MNLINEIWNAVDRARQDPRRRRTGTVNAAEISANLSPDAKTKWNQLGWPEHVLEEESDYIRRYGQRLGTDVENL